MSVSYFESIFITRYARAPVLPGVPERREGRAPEWQSAPSSAALHLGAKKTPASRKKRAAETPLEEVEEAIKGAASSDAAGGEGAAQALNGSCKSALWE